MANRIRPGDSVEWLGERWLVDDVSGYPEQRLNLRKTVVTDPRHRFKDQAQVKRNVPASEVDAHYPMKMAADESVEASDLDDACWEGYEAVGLKPSKGGQMVPNCVPVKSAAWKVDAKRTTHLEGKSGYTACGERAHDDTLVESVKDATCHYCKQAWEKQH